MKALFTGCVATMALLALSLSAGAVSRYDTGPLASMGGITFSADVVAVPELAGGVTVTITYAVAFDELFFVKHGDGFRARYEITAILYGGDEQVAGDSWIRSVEVDDYAETNTSRRAKRESLEITVEPGDYHLKLEIRSLDTRAFGVIERAIGVPAPQPGKLAVGSLVFEREIAAEPSGARSFAVNPTHRYGEDRPDVRVRVPVYGDVGSRYTLEATARQGDGFLIVVFADTVVQSSWETTHVVQFSALDLEVGTYELEVNAEPVTGGAASRARGYFQIVTSPKSWGEDFDKMIAQISYVASRSEVELLMEAPEGERDGAWEAFWDERDPSPGTDENEFRDEFLRRLGHANTQFRTTVEGWQTDMGRVYIQYGEPDDVDSRPIAKTLDSWEIWYYYEHHMKFLFIDREGFGEYRLVDTSPI